jgi:hypothetical protein
MKKKKLIVSAAMVFSFVLGAASINAASNLEKIQANLNHGISFILNGKAWTPKDGNGADVAPISYKGTTYVPLRAVAEATGADVKWDGKTQKITISSGSTDSGTQETARRPFSAKTVANIQAWNYDASGGTTHNKDDLLVGGKQYTAGFIVNKVNSANKGVAFSVPKGTSKVGVSIGYKNNLDEQTEALYSIVDRDNHTLASGSVKSETVVENILELPDGVTELYLTFKDSKADNGIGLLLWDESWVE